MKGAITISCRLLPPKAQASGMLGTPQAAGKESGHLQRGLFRQNVHGDQEVQWGPGFH